MRFLQSTEVESLKRALLQYSDYDEIKRELEIMKVRFTACPVLYAFSDWQFLSVCRIWRNG